MNAEERTETAIAMTRVVITQTMDDPQALIMMMSGEVTPEHIEDVITEILEYLEKTKPEKNEEKK